MHFSSLSKRCVPVGFHTTQNAGALIQLNASGRHHIAPVLLIGREVHYATNAGASDAAVCQLCVGGVFISYAECRSGARAVDHWSVNAFEGAARRKREALARGCAAV